MSAEAEIEWWQNLADTQAEDNRHGVPPYDISHVALYLVSFFGHAHGNFLDLGCGRGRLTNHVARLASKWKIKGTDVSLGAILQARRDAPPNVQYRIGNGTKIPFGATEGLDGAWSITVFQHIPDEQKWAYLRDVHRRLKPGAKFVFTVALGDEDTFLSHQIKDTAAFMTDLVGIYEHAQMSTVDENGWYWVVASK